MGTGAQSFYSTPAFELFRRGLNTQTIKKFRGINAFKSLATMTPDEALDCLNVMVPGWGGLSKFRQPIPISQALVPDPGTGAVQFFDFQQGNGTRQVVAAFPDNSLWYFTWNLAGTALNPGVLIDRGNPDAPPWSMVEANNILFMANGIVMKKWTGANFWNWGIAAPTNAPDFQSRGTATLVSIQRVGGTVTFSIDTTGVLSGGLFSAGYFQIGDAITISGVPGDPTMQGNFTITGIITPGRTYTYASAGANTGPFAGALLSFTTSSGIIAGVTAVRVGGVTTYTFPQPFPADSYRWPGAQVTITGFADASFNGAFDASSGIASVDPAYTIAITVAQPGLQDAVAAGTGTVTTGVNIAISRTYAYAYGNSITGHVSNISPTTTINGPLVNRVVYLLAFASTDPQVDSFNWFVTLDGGGDLFFDGPAVINTALPATLFRDFLTDASLDTAVQGPLLNNPPPVGKYLAVGQSRVFVGNIVGGPNFIAYSGYEQILLGRPEESYPPNNRLLLEIGAEAVKGLGILPSGVVGFGATKKMHMLRGNIEDITLNAPVQFSAFLQELPWDTGTLCHQSIQPTPFGLIFWATDRTVQLFNPGSVLTSTAASLQDISSPVYPILRRATVGSEAIAASAYFNWLERDWYGLTFPIDGSVTNNYTIFWSLNLAANELDIFPCSIGMDFMSTLSTSNLQRILAFSRGGKLFNLPVSQDTVNGVGQLNLIPATGVDLNAFWCGGYFGNESPVRSKMFKRGLLVTDQPGFQVTVRLVDNRTGSFQAPKTLGIKKVRGDGQFSIGQRAARCSVEINFPAKDVSCNVQELTVGQISTSDRM